MTRNIAYCILICSTALVFVIAAYSPNWISDKNSFLHHFVNHELLALLGIIMTITLASSASLHLEFNKIEERYRKRGLTKTRQCVVQDAFFLIALFLASTLIVVIKPLLIPSAIAEAILNGLSLVIVLCNILVLIDITQLAFAIQPDID